MTDQEIAQALQCCAKGLGHDDACENCKVGEIQDRREYIEFAAANVIERLTAENAALREKVPQWISVEDKLPKLGVPVLVNYIGADDGLPHADGVAAWAEWGAVWWEGSLIDSENEVTVPITHWMPLPGAPKRGGSNA